MVKKTSGTRAPRATRTKADLENELEALKAQVGGQDAPDPKSLEVQTARETSVRKATEGVSVEKVVEGIGKTSLDVSRSLSNVSEQLIQKVQEHQDVTEACILARQELEQLHGKEVVASSIEALLAEYEADSKQFQTQTSEARQAWAKEEQLHHLAVKERDAELAKARGREAVDFEYAKNQERKKVQDSFDEQMRQQKIVNRDRQEALERDWSVRETALKSQEQRLADLQAQVNAHPELLKKEVAREVAMATNAMKRDSEHLSALLKKDSESAIALLRQEISSVRATSATQAETISTLNAQLTEAKKQVAEIATKALESASGALALDKVSSMSRNGEGQQRGKA